MDAGTSSKYLFLILGTGLRRANVLVIAADIGQLIEKGLSVQGVVQKQSNFFPLQAYSSEQESDDIDFWRQQEIGQTVPLHHLTVSVLGAAFVGKHGSIEAAWGVYAPHFGPEIWDDFIPFSGPFLEHISLDYESGLHLLRCNKKSSMLEIARRIQNGSF